MTSKVVGEGTYGCVLKPPLKCVTNTKTKHLDYNDKVSKIMVDRDAKNEEKEYNNINNIKGLDKYAITAPIYCKPLENTDFDDSVKNCTNERVQRAFRKKNHSLSMLLLQDGGINIKDFIYNYDAILLSMKSLIFHKMAVKVQSSMIMTGDYFQVSFISKFLLYKK